MFRSEKLLTYRRLPPSSAEHAITRIASAGSKVLAVGGRTHNLAEIFDTKVNRWSEATAYPFASQVFNVPMAAYRGDFVLFGNSIDGKVF